MTLLPDADAPADLLLVTECARAVAGLDAEALKDARADADALGEPVLLRAETGRVLVLPAPDDPDPLEGLRTMGARAAKPAASLKAETVALALPDDAEPADVAAFVEGFVLGGYTYERYQTKEAAPQTTDLVLQTDRADVRAAARAALGRAAATAFARDLVNTVPADQTPLQLAEDIRQSVERFGVGVEVWDRARIEAERMGGLLAVNRGSLDPPAFIVLSHQPAGAVNERPVVLVGKAVTFDTGGLSLKPTKDSMDKMKADMGGGAAVAGAVEAAARLELPVWVVGLIPSTDNRPGGRAYVPGDVVRMRSGATVEVMNTDAEGRMLLADALDYAKTYDPETVIDVATLTGAQRVALGDRVAAVCAGGLGGEVAQALRKAGDATGEYVWPLPMHGFYRDLLKSPVADLKNVGGRQGGAITAAKFLEHFTLEDGEPAYPWAHLDIAGPSFLASEQPYRPPGGTGFGVRLLAEFLQQRADRG